MNRKLVVLVATSVSALAATALLVAVSRQSGPTGAAAGQAAGCGGEIQGVDKTVEIPVTIEVATIKGNEIIHKSNATVETEVLPLTRVDEHLGLTANEVDSLRLAAFKVAVTEHAVAGSDDTDDLQFVNSMVLYVHSLDPDGPADRAVGWYYADEAKDSDFGVLHFEVDHEIDLSDYLEHGFQVFAKTVGGVPVDDVSVEGALVFSAIPKQLD